MAVYPNVINTTALTDVMNKHQQSLLDLQTIEKDLRGRFVNVQLPARALILTLAAGENMLFVGKPGTAKSLLVREVCEHIGIPVITEFNKPHDGYFEYLLTPFTEPGELFGPFNPRMMMREGKMQRITDGMIGKAKIVFLDEVFNGSSAILNTLLPFMNERIYHERGTVYNVELHSMFSATNHIPTSTELLAVHDRFLLRCAAENVGERGSQPDPKGVTIEDLIALVQKGVRETYIRPKIEAKLNLLSRLSLFKKDLQKNSIFNEARDREFYTKLGTLINQVRARRLSSMSNRRIVKFMFLMVVNAIYETVVHKRNNGKLMLDDEDFGLLNFLIDDPRRISDLDALHLPKPSETFLL